MEELEKLIELLERAKRVQSGESKELDDIIKKTKMYLGSYFPLKPSYLGEIDLISFSPKIYVGGMDRSASVKTWESGKEQLINSIDTRIEEIKHIEKQKSKNLIEQPLKTKTVKVEDTERITALQAKIDELESRPKRYSNATIISIISVILVIISGAFLLGKYFGENRFDKDKIELTDKNEKLKHLVDSLTNANLKLNNQIGVLKSEIERLDVIVQKPITEVSISFLSPTSIFDGQILINAKDDFNSAVLSFDGIIGVTKILQEPFKEKEIKVSKGDRFFLKDELNQIWTVNVMDAEVSVDLELIKRK